MKSVVGYLVAAAVCAGIGAAALAAASFESHLAVAQERISTLRYDEAAASLDEAERYAKYARWVPRVGVAVQREIDTRRAALHYWKHEYAQVLPRDADPVGAVDTGNVELQLVVANAVYRAAQARGGSASTGAASSRTPSKDDKAADLQALDEAIGGYMQVLKNDTWHPDAAYNYEYLVRLRDEIQKGRRRLAANEDKDADLGQQGMPAESKNMKKFEIYVPLTGNERTRSGEAGKSGPERKKG